MPIAALMPTEVCQICHIRSSVGVIALVAVSLAIGGSLYVSWTPTGKMTVDGLQGRYMLAVLPLPGWIAPPAGQVSQWPFRQPGR
jgi:uncharacterized membrane protein